MDHFGQQEYLNRRTLGKIRVLSRWPWHCLGRGGVVISVVAMSAVESLSHVRLLVTTWTVTCTGWHIGFTNLVTSYRITQMNILANQVYLQDLLVGFQIHVLSKFHVSMRNVKVFMCSS